MKKRALILSISLLVFAGAAIAAVNSVYLRYYNKDSKTYVFDVKIAGSTTKVEFGSSRTASVTIQGGSETAVISCGCGNVTVSSNDNIEIENGCIKVK